MVIKQEEKIPFELSEREKAVVSRIEQIVDNGLKEWFLPDAKNRDLTMGTGPFSERVGYTLTQMYSLAGWNVECKRGIGLFRIYE